MLLCLQAKAYIQSLPQSPKKDFSQLFPSASPQGESGWASAPLGVAGVQGGVASPRPGCEAPALAAAADLLEKMLELDVDKRVTAAQALAHPFFEPFRDPEEETEAPKFDDSLEHEKLTVDEWKRKSWGSGPLGAAAASLCFASAFLSGLWPWRPCLRPQLGYCLPRAFPPPWADLLLLLCLRVVGGAGGLGTGSFFPSAPYPPEPPCLSQSTSTRRS